MTRARPVAVASFSSSFPPPTPTTTLFLAPRSTYRRDPLLLFLFIVATTCVSSTNALSFSSVTFFASAAAASQHASNPSLVDTLLSPIAISITIIAVSSLFGAAVLLRRFFNGRLPLAGEGDMRGKTVIITGANSGIGYETALDIARRGAKVILACRNVETAAKAREEIAEKTKNGNVIVRKLDLSSFKSIRAFAEEINRTESRLDVLIHNAGMANVFEKKITEDGLEATMATNQYGPFLLTHLLIGLLKKSKPSRIVIVASDLYWMGSLNLENPNPVNSLPGYLYYVSKRANIYFARELSRRLEGSGVTVNSLHPGMVDSGIFRAVPFPLSLPLKAIIKLFFKSPEQGAQTSVHLAVSDELEGVTGKYYSDCKERGLSRSVQDMDKAKRYWEICEELALKNNDPRL